MGDFFVVCYLVQAIHTKMSHLLGVGHSSGSECIVWVAPVISAIPYTYV